MDTKRNQTLEEIEENKKIKINSERALPEQSNADKKALENVTASHSRPLRAYRHQ